MEDKIDASISKEEVEDDANVITLDEFIEEETRLETDANALLGPSDDKNCTYSQGYVGRQALYACKTCRSEDGARVAGVCLACTYHCHEGHDLVELYTKRNFRCDCGNSRFKGKKCNLVSEKESENAKNSYNHNFEGTYCTCNRPYPDPEDSVSDEMIQCIVCEDWYHSRHLLVEMPPEENYSEMICPECTDKLTFLKKYLGYAVTKVTKKESDVVNVTNSDASSMTPLNGKDVETKVSSEISALNGDSTSKTQVPNDEKMDKIEPNKSESDTNHAENGHNSLECQASVSTSPDKNTTSSDVKGCLLERLKDVDREKPGATFWPSNFRSLLCSCVSCKEMYSNLGVSYLLDSSDTVQSYEDKGPSAANADTSKHSMERVLGMLSNIGMDRFSQAEAILNYNELKSNLMTYLAKFAENKKVVREEDIREFFTEMNARKRQKLDLPFNCR